MLTIQIPDHMENRLAPIAQAAGKTIAAYVNDAVAEYLQDLEDIHIAEQRLKDIQSGKAKTVSLHEVMQEYGLDD